MSPFNLFIQNACMEQFADVQKKELKLLINFVRVYCGAKHDTRFEADEVVREISGRRTLLCRECAELVEYAIEKRSKCSLEPKPSCKKCHIHCYGKDHRARIREIMAFSGRRMIIRGRVDYIRHFLF
jgi:hypothetical protein